MCNRHLPLRQRERVAGLDVEVAVVGKGQASDRVIPGGGGGWGDGTAALNFLTSDTADYQQYYTLKESTRTQPWDYLVTVCDKLENTPLAALEDTLLNYMDLDRTLWYLASEIAWTDDDSYVYKGKMDYYVHLEEETGLVVPMEYDGNSALETGPATSWSVFYNATNANYPLLNRLLNVPTLRQRYLAHMRTIIAEEFDTSLTNATFASFRALVDTVVTNDPKKMYTVTQYNNEVQVLKNFINTRKNYINSNAEIQQVAPVITDAPFFVTGVQYQQPAAGQTVQVRSTISSTAGIDNVQLYYSPTIVGRFYKTEMFDDGAHDDGGAGDGVFGGTIPAYGAGTWVRYYVQAASANTAKSVSYLPVGAEHNVFFYTVAPLASGDTSLVINEIMASNVSTAADNFGEYDELKEAVVLDTWGDPHFGELRFKTKTKLANLDEVRYLFNPGHNLTDNENTLFYDPLKNTSRNLNIALSPLCG
jgi:hypothetical protein